MPNTFGFEPYPQRPSPDPRVVGQRLMQPAGGGMEMGMDMDMNPAAMTVAEDEASLRGPGQGPMQYPAGPSGTTMRQLKQLGLSDMEIQLLLRSGGVR